MSKSKWREAEVSTLRALVDRKIPNRDIAKRLKRSVKAVERKLEGLGVVRPKQEIPDAPSQEDHWRDQYKRVVKELQKERKRNVAVEVLVKEVKEVAPLSYNRAPDVYLSRTGQGSPQSAMLLLSDTHIGQVVESDQTLGFGGYNFPTFLRRLKRVETAIHSILSEHVNTPVDELVMVMLGDMLHGNLGHSEEASQVNTLFSQFYGAGHALAQFIRNVASLVPKVRIHTTVGNHTRYSNQHKMPARNRFSNFDQFLYAYIAALTEDIDTVEWNLSKDPFALFDVQGWRFLGSHGEELRGGDKALGIPVHAMGRRISSTSQMMASNGAKPVNYYVFGHHHKPMSIPHTMGELLCNGCFAGMDDFSLAAGFNPIPPVQKFFMVHPKFGRAATYDLNLSLAKDRGELPYEIPNEFEVL